MSRPLDDQHPIVREAAIQEHEDNRILEAVADTMYGPLMRSYGVVDVHRLDAIAEVVNGASRGLLLSARRRGGILDAEMLTTSLLLSLLLGVRLARKGLV
jgi:hypothetical protein